MTTRILVVEQEFTTLDLLLWRTFKREIPGQVEAILDQSPGLARLGHFLPIGTEIKVEVDDAPPRPTTVVRLWN